MRVVVIEPPSPIVKPTEVPGDHSGDDAFVMAMISAVQATIDGPTGWLGRSLGKQTLELRADCWPSSLPYRPVIKIISAHVDDVAIEGTEIEPDGCLRLPSGVARPAKSLRIRYEAGYDGRSRDEGGTGAMPANAKAAVILAVAALKLSTEANGGLRSFQVDGAYTRSFNSPEVVDAVRQKAIERLLAPLQVYEL